MAIGNEFLEELKKVEVSQKRQDKTVRSLIEDFQKAKIIIPEYQRNFVWYPDIQCRFIESIFMNVPIPSIFLLEKTTVDGRTKVYDVLDGVQRLSTLDSFYKNILRLKGLEKLIDLNQITFSMLPEEIKTFFLDQKISIVYIAETTTPDIRFEVFERLNQGSVSLNAQELRNCMFHGPFNDFLKRLSEKSVYKELLSSFGKFKPSNSGKPDKNRMMDVEMVLRFFALYECQKQSKNGTYLPTRKEFLNSYMEEKNKYRDQSDSELFKSETRDLEKLFEKVISMIKVTFGEKSFKRFAISKDTAVFLSPLNKAIFDVQMQGFVDYERFVIEKNANIIYDAFLDVSIFDQKFISATKAGTDHQVETRVVIWKNKLRHVIENTHKYQLAYKAKSERFDKNPHCHVCDQAITILDEAYLEQEQLAHRACVTDKTSNTSRIKTIAFFIKGEDRPIEFENINDALEYFIPLLKDEIGENQTEIERLSSLDFVGTQKKFKLSAKNASLKLRSLKIDSNDETLFMDHGGTTNEVILKMQEIASLYDFFEIVVD